MPRETPKVERVISYLTSRKKQVVIGALLLGVVIYAVLFFIPKPVQFSYARPTCVSQLTLFPSVHKSNSNDFDVTYSDQWKIGNVTLTSMKSCFTIRTEPKEGSVIASTSPFGGLLFRKSFSFAVAAPPVLRSAINTKPIPVSKDLTIPLTASDALYTYSLKIDGKMARCAAKAQGVSCDVPSLKLAQGKTTEYVLSRQFNRSEPKVLSKGDLKTLTATTITAGSVKAGETVYSRPKEIVFEADKPMRSAIAKLTSDNKTIETKVVAEGKTAKLQLTKELPREKTYQVELSKVEAEDGSTLVEPYKMQFSTSGGPKIANVSVGATGVAQSATVLLTFDQNVSKTKDITQFIKFEGGTATIQKRNDTQVAVQLSNLSLCQPFSITINPGLPSEHDIATTGSWKFSSRTTCQQVIRYGTSVQGRPLVAYVYGNGKKRIMLNAGIHGNEVSTVTTLTAAVEYYNAQAHMLPDDVQVIIAPNTNPDGIAFAKRYNANNVNLGRNFPARNWEPDGQTPNGIERGTGGPSPGSEPEAKALMALTVQYMPRLSISYHSQGRLVGINKYGDSATLGGTYASIVGYRTMFDDAEAIMGYTIRGEYEMWVGEAYGVPALVVELPSHQGNYFNSQLRAIQKMISL